MERRGISTVIGIIVLAAFVAVAAASVATFFQSALEDVQDGPDVGFDNALEIRHVSCIGHEFRLTLRNTGDTEIDASSAQIFLYDGGGDLLQVTEDQDFSGKRFEQPDGVDTMTVTVPDAKPLTDEMPFDVAFAEEGVKGVCSPEHDADLVAAWSFDETDRNSTHVFDVVGGNHGGLTGDPVFDGDSVRGDALELDGTDDYVTIADSDELDIQGRNLTATAWVQVPSGYPPPNHRILVEKAVNEHFHRSDGPGWGISIDTSGQVYGGVTDSAGSTKWETAKMTDIRDDTWHHVALRIDNGNTLTFYLNGAVEDSVGFSSVDFNPAVPMGIGASADSNTRHVNAIIDDVRVYNRTLSDEEIRMDAVALG